MATYTALQQDDVEQILAPYDIGPVDKLEALGGGQANSSFIIATPSARYVLSVCDEKSPEEVAVLTATLELLNDHAFLTSRLFKTGSGAPFLEFKGKPVYLKEYIDGTVEETYSLDMAHQVGAALAELHAIQPPENLPDRFAYGIECFDQVLGSGADFSRWLAAHLEQLETCCHPDLPTGLIHGDLFYDNTLFQTGRLAAILDFEEACNYYLIFDLGMCAAGSCCIDGRLSLELTGALAGGYQDTRRLTTIEKELFQLHIFYGAAATAFWRFRQYNMIHPEAGRQDAYVPMQELADQVRSIAPDTFKQAVFG